MALQSKNSLHKWSSAALAKQKRKNKKQQHCFDSATYKETEANHLTIDTLCQLNFSSLSKAVNWFFDGNMLVLMAVSGG